MNYIDKINKLLTVKNDKTLNKSVIDLFAGCGGLALGFRANGFQTIGYEINKDACETYRKNLNDECIDVELTVDTKFPKADIVIGGPPCQPFSVGGKQLGLKDSRDGFPIFISAVKQIKPQFFLFENVRGLLYKNKWYLQEVIKSLSELGYKIDYRLLNASDYDVPQNRERIFVTGFKKIFNYPEPLHHKVTAGEALGDLAYQCSENDKYLTPNMDIYVAKYEKASKCITPRDLQLDKPARSLTCRNLAGSTGDMQRIKLSDGRRRRLTAREAARLQSFPDWFDFTGNETSIFYQIGNAVPPMLSYYMASSVKDYFMNKNITSQNLFDYKEKEYENSTSFY